MGSEVDSVRSRLIDEAQDSDQESGCGKPHPVGLTLTKSTIKTEKRKGRKKEKRKEKQNSLMNYYNSTVCSRCFQLQCDRQKVALGPLPLLIGAGRLASGTYPGGPEEAEASTYLVTSINT
jgi:hypothetical protein